MPQINYKGFYKGISQDDYTTQANQVLFSSGLDLNSDTYSVQLDSVKTDILTTNGNDMHAWAYVEDTAGNRTPLASGEDGETYLTTGTDDTADYTFADNYTTENAINMGGTIYFIRADPASATSQIRIGTTPESNTTLTGGSITPTITPTGDTIPNGTIRSTYPVYNFNDNQLLIGIGGTLSVLEGSSSILTNYEIFSDAIVGITKIGSQFKIYSSTGQIAFWSFGGSSINESYQINDFIRGSINRGNVDYMISGFNPDQTNINIPSGYEAPVVAHRYNSDRLTEDKFEVQMDRPTHLARLGDTIYFVNNTDGDNQALWSYGNKIRSLGDAFQEVVSTTSNGIIRSLFSFQGPGEDTIYMGITEGGIQKMVKYEVGGTRQSTGYMILPILDGGDRTVGKKIRTIQVLTSGTSVDNPIKISASFNQGAYEDLRTITTGGNSARTTISEHTDSWFDVNFRIDITDGGSGTPKFHGMRVIYDIIKEN